jgi:hypothetical protein
MHSAPALAFFVQADHFARAISKQDRFGSATVPAQFLPPFAAGPA